MQLQLRENATIVFRDESGTRDRRALSDYARGMHYVLHGIRNG